MGRYDAFSVTDAVDEKGRGAIGHKLDGEIYRRNS